VLWAEGAELCRRVLILSVGFWSVLAAVTQSLLLLGWAGGAPSDHRLPSWGLAVLGLALWSVQSWLGVRAYGPFGGGWPRGLIGAGLPVWGPAWAVRRFVARRGRLCARPHARSARLAVAYLLTGYGGWLAFGLLGLTANGGVGAWSPVVVGATLFAASCIGSLGSRRYWTMASDPPNGQAARRFVSLWAWWLPVAGPFWAFWQLLEAETPGIASSLIFRAHGSRTAIGAKSGWHHARDTLDSAWQSGSWLGRWTRWRDRPTSGSSSGFSDDRFRRLCHAKKDLLFAEGVLLGWWRSEEGRLAVGAGGELLDERSAVWFQTGVWCLAGIALLGLTSALGCLLRRGPEPLPVLGTHQIGGFLASSWFTLFLGLLVGVCLVPTAPGTTVGLVTSALLSLFLLRVLSGLAQGFGSGSLGLRSLLASAPAYWTGLLVGATALAWFLGSGAPFYWWIAGLILSGVLGGSVLVWHDGASLVHPLHFSDLTRPGLPWRARVWLVVLPLTLVIPGGGLAVPVWVWMRLRWWKSLVATRKALATTPS
jgi:hypothetical protein